MTATDSMFSGNTAQGGGAICGFQSALSIVNSVLTGNSATSSGGGIFKSGGSLTVANSTLAGNTASHDGAGIYARDDFSLINSVVALNHGNDIFGPPAGETGGNLIGIDPAFVRNPGTNGPDDYGDLRLTAASVAIDTGITDRLPADTSDLDGDGDTVERIPFDFDGSPRLHGTLVDIGAYEFQETAISNRETPSRVVTTALDTFDLHDGEISLREAIYYSHLPSLGGPVTFASELSGAVIHLDGKSVVLYEAVTIDASSLAAGLTIDGDDRGRVFTVFSKMEQPVGLKGLTVTGGRAEHGGGIYNMGNLLISMTRIAGNVAGYQGGGIDNDGGILTVAGATLSGNSSGRDGGAMCNDDDGTLTIVDSTLSGNIAAVDGGAIDNEGGLEIVNSRLFGNSADARGGGIATGYGSPLRVTGTTFSQNSAGEDGGAMYIVGRIVVKNSTFAGGSAGDRGREICCVNPGGFILSNSIVALNAVDAVSGRISDESVGNLFAADPGFVRKPGTNGPDDHGDLRLTAQSPAINAGNTDAGPADTTDLDHDGDTTEPLPLDLDGNPRVFGDSVDIGAYEFQEPLADRETPSVQVTTTVDTLDLFDGEISLRDAVCYATLGSLGRTVTFAPALSGGVVRLVESSIPLLEPVTIDASSLPTGLTIDAGGETRAFTVFSTNEQPIQLVGVTITNGQAEYGGGIRNAGNLVVESCSFRKNRADMGGGIYNSGTLAVANSAFSGNEAKLRGGGIDNESALTLTNSTIAGNSVIDASGNGGGLSSYSSNTIEMNNTIVAHNSAPAKPDIYVKGASQRRKQSYRQRLRSGSVDSWPARQHRRYPRKPRRPPLCPQSLQRWRWLVGRPRHA